MIGSIGLSIIGGTLGKAIRVGQSLHGDPSMWTHAFVVIDENRVLQAMPGGSEYGSLDFYMKPGNAVFLPGWPDVRGISNSQIKELADSMLGIPYGFLDYASLTAFGLGIKLPFTRNRIKSKGTMICSQLVDEFYRRLGVQLFDDGRLSMDVTPGDLHIQWTKAISQGALDGRVHITHLPTVNTPMHELT